MLRCPTELELERFLDGRGSDEERGRIAEHRSTCGTCRAWLLEASADEQVVPELKRVHSSTTAPPATTGAATEIEGLDAEPALARYRILRRLGAGGMGVVYEAEQRNPKRRVALKVLRSGGLSERALKRFELEAQVLGRLEHPGIARILEAGTFESHGEAQPFFAMELVAGSSLVRWVAERQVPMRERLGLFLKICDAVQHAHQKGVVHRDLKPANILVTADGEPKVLDFGVARTFDVDVQMTSVLSEAGEIVGTLPYMSPEQLAGDPLEIDTRCDVYALGVLLYELLAGHLPYRATGRSVPEAIKLMESTEPEPLGAVRRELAGDLETIARKALEKDKAQRYSSAEALADDVRHYLRYEPIEARPPSAVYHLRKFARRNRGVVVALALTFSALVVGVAATSWQALRARAAEHSATEQATRARAAEAEARSESAAVEEVNDFLHALIGFDHDDPLGALRGGDTTLRDLVEDAERRLAEQPLEDRRSEAKIRIALGNFWRRLDERGRSADNLERALELRREVFPSKDLKIAEALNTVGVSRYERGDYKGAEDCWREALDIYDALHDPAHAPKVATTIGNLSSCALKRGDVEEAERLLLRAREMHTASMGPYNMHVATDVEQFAELKLKLGEVEVAIALLEESIEIARRAGQEGHLHAITTLGKLANVLRARDRLTEAEELMRRAVALTERALGDDHPETARRGLNLAVLLYDAGRPEEAESVARETLAVYRSHSVEPTELARAAGVVGMALSDQGEDERALELLFEAKALYDRSSPNDPVAATMSGVLGRTLVRLARYEEATPHLRSAIEGLARVPGTFPTHEARARLNLGVALYMQGDLVEAERFMRAGIDAIATARERYGPRHDDVRLRRHLDLAQIVGEQGRSAEAEQLIELALDESLELFGPRHATTGLLLQGLARRLAARGELAAAEALLRELLANDVTEGSDQTVRTLRVTARLELGSVLARNGTAEEVLALVEEAREVGLEELDSGDTVRDTMDSTAARVLCDAGLFERAEPLARSAVAALEQETPVDEASARCFTVHGRSLIGLGRVEEAEAVLRRCLEGADQFEGARADLTAEVRALLAEL